MMKDRKWSLTIRAKGNLKLSHGGPSQRQTSGTNQDIPAAKDKHQVPTKISPAARDKHQVPTKIFLQPETNIRYQPRYSCSQRQTSGTNQDISFSQRQTSGTNQDIPSAKDKHQVPTKIFLQPKTNIRYQPRYFLQSKTNIRYQPRYLLQPKYPLSRIQFGIHCVQKMKA